MARKDGPTAANKAGKNMSFLIKNAIKLELPGVVTNPARAADKRKERDEGFRTWTESGLDQYFAHHGPGTKARLPFLLALNAGAGRADLAALTWDNIEGDRITYRRGKTGAGSGYPVLPELAHHPAEAKWLLPYGDGLPYKATTTTNRFKDYGKSAGLAQSSFHGTRKG